jgi:hypothetical protein
MPPAKEIGIPFIVGEQTIHVWLEHDPQEVVIHFPNTFGPQAPFGLVAPRIVFHQPWKTSGTERNAP